MSTIFCRKLQQDAEAIPSPPFPGQLGKLIQNNISLPGWKLWLVQQTKLINEYKLDPLSTKAQMFLKEEMLSFLSLEE